MKKKLNAKQKRVKAIIEKLQHYMETYSDQTGYLDYSDETIIDDVLYGLGIAIDDEKYHFNDGYRKFKAKLIKHIGDDYEKSN